MRTQIAFVAVAVAAAALLAAAAPSASARSQSTLGLQAVFASIYRFGEACPPDAPPSLSLNDCVRFVGNAVVPGLGRATTAYIKTFESTYGCDAVTQFRTAVISVAGKGELHVAMAGPACGPTAPAEVPPLAGTISGGTGIYAGASGSVVFRSSVYAGGFGPSGIVGSSRDTWTGTISVPGLEFDLTAPVLRGATARTVRAPKGATRVRVRYSVTAQDAVDGVVAAACKPRSGSFFRAGRTKVTCSATDTSGNTRKASFAITVR